MEEQEYQYKLTRSYLYPIVRLENALSSHARHKMYRLTVFFLFFFLVLIVGIILLNNYSILDPSIEYILDLLLPKIFGLVLVVFVFWVIVFLLEAFFRSYYFKEKEDDQIQGRDRVPEDLFSFHVLQILLRVRGDDITEAYLMSSTGRAIMHRVGLRDTDILEYLEKRDASTVYELPKITGGKVYTIEDLSEYVFDHDHDLADTLFSLGVQKKEFLGAVRWVVRQIERSKRSKRWWTADNLDKIKGIGADWAYGQAYILQRYAHELTGHEGGAALGSLSAQGERYLERLEDTLSLERESNMLLVGNPGEGITDVLYSFAKALQTGEVPPNLEGKRPMMFDGELLVSNTGSKSNFEMMFVKILNDAVEAGNVILVFNNFPAFIQSARALESDVVSLMEPYLSAVNLQILAISQVSSYHDVLEQHPIIRKHFETMLIDKPDNNEVVEVLEKVAERLETQSGVLFTYGTLTEAVTASYQHFSDPVMPDKAIDIIVELPSRVVREQRMLVEKSDVHKLIEEKIGVPTGEIKGDEREALMNMEEELHRRVVGQDEAVHVLSNAMRRSRAGIRDTDRPIGSFLFIGPTGVGKTETAKALAELFFGDEEKMSRIDMSEFSGDNGVSRLIGSYEKNKAGVLSRILKKRPYGVLLLDEFEKSSTEVHDLFLQILDEGFFTDVRGTRVNARDSICIATSNAGSDIIFQRMKEGADPKHIREEVIGHIISQGIFKPEFLNRFDAVVLFHPLEPSHMKIIAELMLERLQERLKTKGLRLEVNDELVEYVAKQGSDPIFGARPMNRYIQEHVEQIVAMKFIRGDIAAGTTFTLSPKELERV